MYILIEFLVIVIFNKEIHEMVTNVYKQEAMNKNFFKNPKKIFKKKSSGNRRDNFLKSQLNKLIKIVAFKFENKIIMYQTMICV